MSRTSLEAVLPNPQQQLLLEAALYSGPQARMAWEKWAAQNDLDAVDGASFRHLPLVYKNLAQNGGTKDLDSRVKGAYRYWWVRQGRLFGALGEGLCALQSAGIRTLLLKGVPLAMSVYPDPATRSMEDADLCVPLPDLSRALDILGDLGWKMRRPEDAVFSLRHEVTLQRGEKLELDVQRFALTACRWHEFNQRIFDRAHTFEFGLSTSLAPRAEDHLLIVCVHGLRWSEYQTHQWIPDLVLMLRAIEQKRLPFDWDDLLAISNAVDLDAPVRDALCYVHTRFNAPVPDSVLRRLNQARPPLVFRAEHDAKLRPHDLKSAFWLHTALYTRLRRSGSVSGRIGPLGYCQRYWNISQPWRVPGHLWKRGRNLSRGEV